MAFADKPEKDLLKTTSVGNKKTDATAKVRPSVTKEATSVISDKKVKIVTADKRSDVVVPQEADEKSDIYEAASQSYEAGAPVSQGNLYYYYYPVAAYPVHADDKVSNSASSGSSVLDSPLIFLLVPLVLLLIAVPVVSLLTSNTSSGRSFGRASHLDEKFGSFEELQEAIDHQLSKYMSALDSDRCMDRIVCELGVKASNIPHKSLFFSVVDWLAPEHGLLGYGRMTILKQAAEGNYSMDTCRKFVCNPPASISQEQPRQ